MKNIEIMKNITVMEKTAMEKTTIDNNGYEKNNNNCSVASF